MKKTLQKGFSLVELLVVVAIIGVLAGVGIVGYQSYTDSAKSRVAVANFNSVKRFVETELTLLNNNIQTVSGALSAATGNCTTLEPYTVHSVDMEKFARGLLVTLQQMVMEISLKIHTMLLEETEYYTTLQMEILKQVILY